VSGVQYAFSIISKSRCSISTLVNSIAVLANLSVIEENRLDMIRLNCIETVLHRMQLWSKESSVQAEICAALSNLSSHDDYAKIVAQSQAPALIMKALDTHIKCQDLHIQGFQALSSMGQWAKSYLETSLFNSIISRSMIHWADDIQG
jgi:hypothetical protein